MIDKSGPNSQPKSPGSGPEPAIQPDDAIPVPPLDEEPYVEEITLPKDTPQPLADAAFKAHASATRGGQIIGALLCLAGVVLIILGYSGNVTWKIIGGGISSSLQTGSLGVVVVIAGVIILWRYRPKITITGNGNAQSADGK